MANQGRPDDRWCVFGQIECARLIVEMVAPACSAIAASLMFNQPLQRRFRPFRPNLIPGCLVKADKASRQKAHALCGVLPLYAKKRTQIQGEASHSLQKYGAQQAAFKRKGSDKP